MRRFAFVVVALFSLVGLAAAGFSLAAVGADHAVTRRPT